MTNKRFIDNSILPKAFRKLEPSLKIAWYWLWNSCDPSGYWEIDEDFFEFENGFEFPADFTKKFLEFRLLSTDGKALLITDFIRVNAGEVKENYNPHKPIWRAIEKNNLKLNSSLNQACFKLVDEDKDEDVGKDEDEEVDENNASAKTEVWPTFRDFWDLYDKKVHRPKTESIWKKLKQNEKELVMSHVSDYIQSQPEKRFRKNPDVYLRNKSWQDEIIDHGDRKEEQRTINVLSAAAKMGQ